MIKLVHQLILVLGFLCAPSYGILASSSIPPGIDVLHYDIHLTLSDSSKSISANVVIHFSCEKDARSLHLDFAPLHIDSVVLDGQAIAFSQQNDQLVIDFTAKAKNANTL